MKKILVSAPYFVPVVDRFRPRFAEHGLEPVVADVRERLSEAELLDVMADIAGVISGDDAFTDRVLAASPKLRVISKWGTGIDSIDQEACNRRGVAVRNTPNAFSEPVADTALASILAFSRRLHESTELLRKGGWEKLPGVALNECTIGILGVGDCGRAVARRAAAFGARLLGCDPRQPPAEFLASTGMEMVSKDQLFSESDFLSINCDLNPTSRGIVNAAMLSRMKLNAVVINTARGPLVDEPALIDALRTRKIAGAALDVFEAEPLPQDSPLKSMSNVIMAAHNANSSPKAWEHVHENTFRNLVAVLNA